MALLINDFNDFYWFGEFARPYSEESILYKDIHLGVQTNIVCLDDRPKDYESFRFSCLEHTNVSVKINGWDYHVTLPAEMHDVSATLYLGKITFKKNKYGNLAPIYIPSTITESSFEGLNTFWLNEINPSKMSVPEVNKSAPSPLESVCFHCDSRIVDPEGYKYLNNFYFRSSKNITLTKAQIISYFTELHKLNTTFIQNYIDSINKNDGIRANILHDKLYDELLDKGLLQKDMFQWYSNAPKAASPQAKLLALDYFKKTNQYNFTIVFFDELFYHYLFASVSNFIVAPQSGEFCAINNLLFNAGAYKKYYHLTKKTTETYNINPKMHAGTREKRSKFNNWLDESRQGTNNATLFFSNNVAFIFTDFMLFYNKHNVFASPNRVYRTYPATGKIKNDDKDTPYIYAPSPLGNYYFEIASNKDTFIEYYQRIYPKLDNPPKGWSKEMMQKLELRLE